MLGSALPGHPRTGSTAQATAATATALHTQPSARLLESRRPRSKTFDSTLNLKLTNQVIRGLKLSQVDRQLTKNSDFDRCSRPAIKRTRLIVKYQNDYCIQYDELQESSILPPASRIPPAASRLPPASSLLLLPLLHASASCLQMILVFHFLKTLFINFCLVPPVFSARRGGNATRTIWRSCTDCA